VIQASSLLCAPVALVVAAYTFRGETKKERKKKKKKKKRLRTGSGELCSHH
jgi:hypothetical protein